MPKPRKSDLVYVAILVLIAILMALGVVLNSVH
jgi:hypothetical protein